MNEKVSTEKSYIGSENLPMSLAESNTNGRRRTTRIRIYLWPTLLIAIGVIGILISIKILTNTGFVTTTEIVSVKWISQTSNDIVEQDNKDVFYHFKNETVSPEKRRKKRLVITPSQNENKISSGEVISKYKDKDFRRAREIIMNHNVLCKDKNKNEICKDLVSKLGSLANDDESETKNTQDPLNLMTNNNASPSKEKSRDIVPTDVTKRETRPLPNVNVEHAARDPYENPYYNPSFPANSWSPHSIHSHHSQLPLTDTCLLARLLKENYSKGTNYVPQEYIAPYGQSNNRYHSPIDPNPYNREMEIGRQVHPQDVDIFRKYLTSKPHSQDPVTIKPTNSSTREAQCTPGTIPCNNGEDCIPEKQWCDGNVNCGDISDEARCSCKSRVDKSRLCDGYFDCPFGEDEMGCNGCSESTFSCEDLDVNSQSTCFTKEQRCNNVVECPNHRDEFECNSLSPSLHKKPLFAISNTEGFLERNFRGDWYAVCKNPYMWAHDACRRETGLIIRPPFIQLVPIDPMARVNYLNTGPGGFMYTENTCFNSSAVYVTCPDLLCGTRMLTTSQLLRKNALENRLFGRNKRFLLSHNPFKIYYGHRRDRLKKNKTEGLNKSAKYLSEKDPNKRNMDDKRTKRAQSRVVGGRPSQPAAWPWMAAMYRNGMFHCGGVIISQSWVMSAAHCVHEFWNHYYEIQVGMLRRFSFSPQEQNHEVTHIIVNQKYSQQDMKNDLSLLKVDTIIQFSRWVRPICLPGPDTAGADWLWGPPAGTVCTAVGWGATVEHGPDPDHMREVEVPIWSSCKHEEDIAGKEICAGPVEGGKDACQGDSGGPLLCRNPLNSQQWYVAGIVSHGDGCARKDEPGVYTRVSLFSKWIRHHISSKTLPAIQPKQICPGFKCKSGIIKCLPEKRVCDKIIDCLDGEDEINCNVMRTFDDIFSSRTNNDNKNANEKSVEINNDTEILVLNQKSSRKNSENNQKFQEIKFKSIDNPNSETNLTGFTIEDIKRSSEIQENNFSRESTLELSKSSESVFDIEDNFEERATVDPDKSTLSREAENTVRGDMVTFSVISSKESLESMSSTLEHNQRQNDDISVTDTAKEFLTSTQTVEIFDTSILTTTDTILQETDVTEAMIPKITENRTLPNITNDFTKLKTNESINNNFVESKSLIVELLPTTLTPPVEENEKDINRIDKIENKQITSSNNSDKSKKLPDFDDKIDIIHKIEDIVLSELHPAKVRKKHLVPKQFECRQISQVIPYRFRCDHKADCEDGTDELGCSCVDYLTTFDENILCDGVFDCADGQDEIDCYTCAEDRFLCRKSQICLPEKYVCDGTPQCPQGEDEFDCFALSNGKELTFEFDDRPKINLEGFLTKKHKNDWHVICEDNLSTIEQEQAATHICRYLGFSSANRYYVKNINVKKDQLLKFKTGDQRSKRSAKDVPVHFAYRAESDEGEGRHIKIKDPEFIKEQCVANITKTCMSLYVYCDHLLFDYDVSQDLYKRDADIVSDRVWPWNAKIYVEGDYKCSGVLLELSLVLISQTCLWDSLLDQQHISVVLGAQRVLSSTNGPYEQIREVQSKTELYHSKVILLHLKEPVEYSTMVKPMIYRSPHIQDDNAICVAIGQDERNTTISVFLKETEENCSSHNTCFVRVSKSNICLPGMSSHRHWAGIISCHTKQGWYPAASFVDSRGECGTDNRIIATEIMNLKNDIWMAGKKDLSGHNSNITTTIAHEKVCDGARCSRGRCIDLLHVCNGVRDCEDGNDESELACTKKTQMCHTDPHHKGCECSSGQLRCHNGKCILKQLFNDGRNDCGDRTDEPDHLICSRYLARVMPSGLCDGIMHCEDRSDEDPMFCKCYAKRTFLCGKTSNVDHCVAPDMVCDGIRDCPNGEDESTCIGLKAPSGTPSGTGQVIVRSHGVWHTKCYPTQNHTRTELEGICRELGYLSGHAREVKTLEKIIPYEYNTISLDEFSDIMLNNNTRIKLRNTQEPLARPKFDETLENCHPVYIECR